MASSAEAIISQRSASFFRRVNCLLFATSAIETIINIKPAAEAPIGTPWLLARYGEPKTRIIMATICAAVTKIVLVVIKIPLSLLCYITTKLCGVNEAQRSERPNERLVMCSTWQHL